MNDISLLKTIERLEEKNVLQERILDKSREEISVLKTIVLELKEQIITLNEEKEDLSRELALKIIQTNTETSQTLTTENGLLSYGATHDFKREYVNGYWFIHDEPEPTVQANNLEINDIEHRVSERAHSILMEGLRRSIR